MRPIKKLIRMPTYDLNERPFMIIWETTQACDLSCRHCRASAIPDMLPGTLSTAAGKNLLEQVAAFGKPSPMFVFTGGDPFKRPDLFELIEYGRSLGIAMAVSPSGTPTLNKENLSKIKEAGAKAISLSIDGSNPERHDTFRRVDGSFNWTVDGWESAHEVGLKVQVNTTVTRYNLLDLPKIFELVRGQGAMTWSLFFLVPVGRGLDEEAITPAEYEGVMHFLYDCSKYLSAKTTEGHHYKRVLLQRSILEEQGRPIEDLGEIHPIYYQLKAELDEIVAKHQYEPRVQIHRPPLHINAGKGFVFISWRGDVYPSGFMPIKSGSVCDSSLVDVYRDAPLFQQLRTNGDLEGRCGLCEFVGVCGGSRSRAYAVSGNPLAEEPFCDYEPGSFPYQDSLQLKLTQSKVS